MQQKRMITTLASLLFSITLVLAGQAKALTPIEQLGSNLYFDENLSQPGGQSCASCHDPAFGFVDPDSGLPVSEGVLPSRFGNRNSPSAGYAMYAPIFHLSRSVISITHQSSVCSTTG